MHDWLGFEKTKEGRGQRGANLLYCPGCKVTLCRMCYNDFHKVPDLLAIKHLLQQECLERRDKKKIQNERQENQKIQAQNILSSV